MVKQLDACRNDESWSTNKISERVKSRSIIARYACTRRVIEHAYRVRYRGYLSHGYITPNHSELLSDQFDNTGYAPSIVVYDNDHAVGTVRLCSYDPAGPLSVVDALPCAELFELTSVKLQRHFSISNSRLKLSEVSKLAKLPQYQSDIVTTVALFKMLKILVVASEADIIFAAVRVQHMKIYRRLGFEIIETPRLFGKDNVVLGLMACRPSHFRLIEDRAEAFFRRPNALKSAQTDDFEARFLRGEQVEVFPSNHLKQDVLRRQLSHDLALA